MVDTIRQTLKKKIKRICLFWAF